MPGFKVDSFGGVIPRLGARLLPNNAAQTAGNAQLFSGELRSWRRLNLINTPTKGGALKSMYRMYDTSSDYWLSWTDNVDVVKGPVTGTAFKLYYTGDTTTGTYPKKTNLALSTAGTGSNYPKDFLQMGVPAPGSAPTVIGTGGTSTVSETRVYLYTYVTSTGSWAEEGPPSPYGTGTGKTDAGWVIAALSTGTSGKYALTNGAAIKRIYRGLSDNAGNTNYQLALDNVPMVTTSTSDTVANADLGLICPTFIPGVVNSEWVAPPTDMHSLVALPNGMLAGASGNQVCFCEPFFPHAWPIRYRLTTEYEIVSMGVYGQTLIVTTKGFPYAITGSRPDSMSMQRIEENHPCVSKRGTVSFPFGVMWPTPDGLALAGVGGAINAIDKFMKRNEWRDQCFPDTLLAAQFQNVFFGFFNNGTEDANLIFDKANEIGPLTFGNFGAQGVWNDPETAKLYLLQNGSIYEWDADTINNSSFDWKSKVFVFPRPVNLGAIEVQADYASLSLNSSVLASASALDLATNTGILGTGEIDTANLVAWSASTSYAIGDIRKGSSGAIMLYALTAGTSSATEAAYPGTLGGTATDGTVNWKRIWDLGGVTKGDNRGHILRNHTQYTTADPAVDGTAGNQWGIMLRGSLLVGGAYANYDERNLLVQVYADGVLRDAKYLTSNKPVRVADRGFKAVEYEVRFQGNIAVKYFRLASTMQELAEI